MAINIKQLRQKKTDTLAKANAIFEAAQAANRDLTETERTEFDAVMALVKTTDTDIQRAEAVLDVERNMPSSSAIQVSVPEAGNKPWGSLGEQLKAISSAAYAVQNGRHSQIDPRLLASLGANETVPAEGGFLVGPEYAAGLLKKAYDVGEIAKRCGDMSMTSSRMIINAVDEDSRVNGSRWGGILSYWLAEGQTYNGTKPKFRQVQLVANKLIGLCYVTEEQLEDGPALETYIGQAFPDEFAFNIDNTILNGTGAGQPLGVLTSTAVITQAKDSGQLTGTVSSTNILNMYSRLWAPSRKNAVWLINQSVEPQLYPLLIAGTTATTAALLYVPNGTFGNNSGYGMMLGLPVIPVEQTANLSSLGDIVLGDFQQYLLAKRNEVRSDTSIHVAFLTGEQAFRFMVRLDGQPWWKKPLTPFASGAPTLSPFVTLQAR